MTSSSGQAPTVTLEKAWARLMFTMGGTNTQRAKDAQKFARILTQDRKRY